MGHFMRFIVSDSKRVELGQILEGLQSADPAYSLGERRGADAGELRYDDDVYGLVEINRPGDRLFDEELDELKDSVLDSPGRKVHVLRVLNEATAVVAVQVLWQGRETGSMPERLDPLWKWLFANYRGLMQVDAEGYYDASGLILQVA
jgi:hypothetical protein